MKTHTAQQQTGLIFQKINLQLFASHSSHNTRPINFFELCAEHHFCLREVAYVFGVSEVTLRSRFKEFTALTPKAWIREQRVLAAIRMFRQGISAEVVMTALHYHDYPHLSKDFKVITGLTPKNLKITVAERQLSPA